MSQGRHQHCRKILNKGCKQLTADVPQSCGGLLCVCGGCVQTHRGPCCSSVSSSISRRSLWISALSATNQLRWWAYWWRTRATGTVWAVAGWHWRLHTQQLTIRGVCSAQARNERKTHNPGPDLFKRPFKRDLIHFLSGFYNSVWIRPTKQSTKTHIFVERVLMKRGWNLIRLVLVNVRGKCCSRALFVFSSCRNLRPTTAEQDQTVAGRIFITPTFICSRMTKNNILFTHKPLHRDISCYLCSHGCTLTTV